MSSLRNILLIICLSVSFLFAQKPELKVDGDKIILSQNKKEWFSLRIECGFSNNPSIKSKYGSFEFKDGSFDMHTWKPGKVGKTEKGITKVPGKVEIDGKEVAAEFQLRVNVNGQVSINFYADSTKVNRTRYLIDCNKKEHFFGAGEQFDHIRLNGKAPYIFSHEQGIGRGDKGITFRANVVGVEGDEWSTYHSVPYIITSKNRALLGLNKGYQGFNFTTDSVWVYWAWSHSIAAEVWKENSPYDLIKSARSRLGYARMLPEWSFGFCVGAQGGSKEVNKKLTKLRNAGVKVDAVWIQDWVGKRETKYGSRLFWNWEADNIGYPEIHRQIKKWNNDGLHVLGYVNPFLAVEGRMGKEAAAEKYVVMDEDGDAYQINAGGFQAYLLDLTNKKAFEWMKAVMKKQLIDNGFAGWMADFGEWLPEDAKLKSGVKAVEYHNQYIVDWARLNREVLLEAGMSDSLLFFMRAGFTGSGNYTPLYWTGDQSVDWGEHDGLPSAIRGMLSAGISGIPINHTEAGGYTSMHLPMFKLHRSQELLLRWAEVSVFTSFFRTHEGLHPEKNHQVWSDSTTTRMFSRYVKMRKAITPYLTSVNAEAVRDGKPMVRHLWLEFPDDPKVLDVDNVFMLGSHILVMPVLEPDAITVKAYLPKGRWIHAFTGEVYPGGKTLEVPAPIGSPAVFIRKGKPWSNRLKGAFEDLR